MFHEDTRHSNRGRGEAALAASLPGSFPCKMLVTLWTKQSGPSGPREQTGAYKIHVLGQNINQSQLSVKVVGKFVLGSEAGLGPGPLENSGSDSHPPTSGLP